MSAGVIGSRAETDLADAGVANEQEFEEVIVFAGVHDGQGGWLGGGGGERGCVNNPRQYPPRGTWSLDPAVTAAPSLETRKPDGMASLISLPPSRPNEPHLFDLSLAAHHFDHWRPPKRETWAPLPYRYLAISPIVLSKR